MIEKNKSRLLPVIGAFVLIVSAAAYLVYKLGQHSAKREKWKDYDDYGWA